MTQRYSVNREMRGDTEIFTLIEADRAEASVAPGLGNNCFAFSVTDPVIEPVDFDEFRKRPTSYGIPVLFPFPNRIRDGEFQFRGQTYRVDPPRHGFVRDKPWKVVSTGASDREGAWITSSIEAEDYAEQILKQFPFPFTLEVTYRLRQGALEMETTARNTGSSVMPIGFGIHPYFRKPEKGSVQVPARKRWELSDSLPTGNLLDVEGGYDLLEPRDVNTLGLDDIFTDLITDSNQTVRCTLSDDQTGTATVVEFEARQFPHVVVYTPPAPRRAICIEPNTCPTDAFNLQSRGVESNLIETGPGQANSFRVSFYTSNNLRK
jgi:aldose 1-epimerase